MRGRRGYRKPLLFNWIGATTPLPEKTHRLMSQLGTRLLFNEIPAAPPSEDELVAYAESDCAAQAERRCRRAVSNFLIEFFAMHPIASVTPGDIAFTESARRQLVRWAMLLVAGRAGIRSQQYRKALKPIAAMPREGPYKVVNYFMDLARGHALVHGRNIINPSDVKLVGHIAVSSIPGHLRPIIRALTSRMRIDTNFATILCEVSAPTARKYLQQLELLGIVELTKGSSTTNQPDFAKLAKDFSWLNPDLESTR
jgi:hypothetical protein